MHVRRLHKQSCIKCILISNLSILSLISSQNVAWLNECYCIFKHLKDTEILVLPATDDQESVPNVIDSYEVINENEIDEN
jgi:hypothetical protein